MRIEVAFPNNPKKRNLRKSKEKLFRSLDIMRTSFDGKIEAILLMGEAI